MAALEIQNEDATLPIIELDHLVTANTFKLLDDVSVYPPRLHQARSLYNTTHLPRYYILPRNVLLAAEISC